MKTASIRPINTGRAATLTMMLRLIFAVALLCVVVEASSLTASSSSTTTGASCEEKHDFLPSSSTFCLNKKSPPASSALIFNIRGGVMVPASVQSTTAESSSSSSSTTTTTTNTASTTTATTRGSASLGSSNSASAGSTASSNLQLLNVLDLFGTCVFAFSGSVTAGKRGMDLLGMIIIACITSIGGGTVRDLLLDVGPVFWIKQTIYLKICILTCLTTFVFWPYLESKLKWKDSAKPVCVADAIGLGAFAILGTQKAVDMELDDIICILCGLGTATFGGVTRDILCQQSPRIMYPHRTMYAGPAILGSTIYILLLKLVNNCNTQSSWLNKSAAAYVSFLVTFTARILSFNNPARLPYWKMSDEKINQNRGGAIATTTSTAATATVTDDDAAQQQPTKGVERNVQEEAKASATVSSVADDGATTAASSQILLEDDDETNKKEKNRILKRMEANITNYIQTTVYGKQKQPEQQQLPTTTTAEGNTNPRVRNIVESHISDITKLENELTDFINKRQQQQQQQK